MFKQKTGDCITCCNSTLPCILKYLSSSEEFLCFWPVTVTAAEASEHLGFAYQRGELFPDRVETWVTSYKKAQQWLMMLLTLKPTSSHRNPVQIQMAMSLLIIIAFILTNWFSCFCWLLQGTSGLLTAPAHCYYAGVILMSQLKEVQVTVMSWCETAILDI